MPGSVYGSERDFQKLTDLFLTAVTALNAGWVVSNSFFPAERKLPWAPKLSAAWFFWSVVSVLRTPNQLMASRTAAVEVRNRCAGEVEG